MRPAVRVEVKMVRAGEPVLHVHAQTAGELDYALAYAARNSDLFDIGDVT